LDGSRPSAESSAQSFARAGDPQETSRSIPERPPRLPESLAGPTATREPAGVAAADDSIRAAAAYLGVPRGR